MVESSLKQPVSRNTDSNKTFFILLSFSSLYKIYYTEN
ncbi:hypothetical protein [Salmonella phage Tennessee]